jgi:DNA processing protein
MVKEKNEELFYRIALTQTELVGDKTGRQLLQHFGSASAIFHAPLKQLMAIDGFGQKKAGLLRNEIDEAKINQEIAFMEKHTIAPLFITDKNYPKTLKTCADAPLLLYYKGDVDMNSKKMVAVIGTRKNTDYGMRITEELVEGLQALDVVIVSGLAFGIDIIAHRKAVQLGMPTIGVMAHGLDTIYPSQHKHITREMVKNGGLLTEYISGTNPDRFNFPMRNRIVAGMCDVTVVIETETKGGAMITAKLAAGYNREVAAFAGRTIDKKSEGCNYLIRTNMAQMITGAEDLMEMMNWETKEKQKTIQPKLFSHLTDDEVKITNILEGSEGMHIDEVFLKAGVNTSILSSLLLTLELNGVVKALPGKRYRLV